MTSFSSSYFSEQNKAFLSLVRFRANFLKCILIYSKLKMLYFNYVKSLFPIMQLENTITLRALD